MLIYEFGKCTLLKLTYTLCFYVSSSLILNISTLYRFTKILIVPMIETHIHLHDKFVTASLTLHKN